jgi:hypothetical protein
MSYETHFVVRSHESGFRFIIVSLESNDTGPSSKIKDIVSNTILESFTIVDSSPIDQSALKILINFVSDQLNEFGFNKFSIIEGATASGFHGNPFEKYLYDIELQTNHDNIPLDVILKIYEIEEDTRKQIKHLDMLYPYAMYKQGNLHTKVMNDIGPY